LQAAAARQAVAAAASSSSQALAAGDGQVAAPDSCYFDLILFHWSAFELFGFAE
jgi:hypothetical protein